MISNKSSNSFSMIFLKDHLKYQTRVWRKRLSELRVSNSESKYEVLVSFRSMPASSFEILVKTSPLVRHSRFRFPSTEISSFFIVMEPYHMDHSIWTISYGAYRYVASVQLPGGLVLGTLKCLSWVKTF